MLYEAGLASLTEEQRKKEKTNWEDDSWQKQATGLNSEHRRLARLAQCNEGEWRPNLHSHFNNSFPDIWIANVISDLHIQKKNQKNKKHKNKTTQTNKKQNS